ncbi:MAG: imidazoleglycerol-phosphate dehydratase HisB [Trueperaceae bacterium]|nr:imidazoleglycerol-phosphate dehydratase HisB [Trueperaceae bacterium]
MARSADRHRTTRETDVRLALDLDGGDARLDVGHGFLAHLLDAVARHGRLGLQVTAHGDEASVDVHHLAEDVGITMGAVVRDALGDSLGIERYGDAWVPMDETLAHVVVDLSGRPYLAFDPSGFEGDAHGFTVHHLREFLRGFANHAGATIHVRVLAGRETHHVAEAVAKAFARALRDAVRVTGDAVPSTKGVL